MFKLIDSGVLLSKTIWNKEQLCSICPSRNILKLINGIRKILCMFFIRRVKHRLIAFPPKNMENRPSLDICSVNLYLLMTTNIRTYFLACFWYIRLVSIIFSHAKASFYLQYRY